MLFRSKISNTEESIFSKMSSLATRHDALNLSQGFPNFDPDERLIELVKKYQAEGYHQYAPMKGVIELRKTIGDAIEKKYNRKIDLEQEICVTAGATQAIFTIISALISIGDEVLIIEPAYDSYRPSIEVAGGVVKSYQLKKPNFRIDWSALKSMVSDRTKMIIINTPHNPTGSVLTSEDIENLKEITRGTDIVILSDEVYEYLIYDGLDHESILKDDELFSRSIATYSFGKSLHCTGWKMGYVVGPKQLMKQFYNIHQYNVFSVNRPLQHAIAEYLQEKEHRDGLSEFYQRKRDKMYDILNNSRLISMNCSGTYFMLADYSNISNENEMVFTERLTKENGIAFIPLSPFYADSLDQKLVRICFAKTDDVLDQAGGLIQQM